jgi:predicted type IV restriction endonuclease
MPLRERILQARDALQGGRLVNEAAVSTGVVLSLLDALGWPVFDTQIVAPEYTLEGRRVDYALCHPRTRPAVFVEVKQPGRSLGADRQLFEYAFHTGVPMAVLTDGREWHFYLPAEQGDYQERRVYRLDLLERDVEECERRFRRYLGYDAVREGEAYANARRDYQSIRREREAEAALPDAWCQLVGEADETLVALLADRVESLSGYRPEHEAVTRFLAAGPPATDSALPPAPRPRATLPQSQPSSPREVPQPIPDGLGKVGVEIEGRFIPARNGRDALAKLFSALADRDPTFLERFAALPEHGRTRRYLARTPEELYPGRPDLAEQHVFEVRRGWWIGTNNSKSKAVGIMRMACDVAGLRFGKDIRVDLG